MGLSGSMGHGDTHRVPMSIGTSNVQATPRDPDFHVTVLETSPAEVSMRDSANESTTPAADREAKGRPGRIDSIGTAITPTGAKR